MDHRLRALIPTYSIQVYPRCRCLRFFVGVGIILQYRFYLIAYDSGDGCYVSAAGHSYAYKAVAQLMWMAVLKTVSGAKLAEIVPGGVVMHWLAVGILRKDIIRMRTVLGLLRP